MIKGELIKGQSVKKLLCYLITTVVAAIVFYPLFYRQCIILHGGDYMDHNGFVEPILNGSYKTMYPGYQWIVGYSAKVFGTGIDITSVAILTICMIVCIFVTYYILGILADDNKISVIRMMTAFIINMVQPIFTGSIRPGYSSVNGYISPTQIVCKPAVYGALAVFFSILTKDDKGKGNIKNRLILTFLLIVSCIIKPLFAMAFVPAMGLYYFVDVLRKKLSVSGFIKEYVCRIYPLFITGLFLIGQYIYLDKFSTAKYEQWDGGSIALGFMVSWKSVVPNVPLSIVFAYFFPIVIGGICLIRRKTIGKSQLTERENAWLGTSLWYGLVSFIYMAFLYQTNGHEQDCNFRNAWIFTFYMIFMVFTEVLIRWIKEAGISIKKPQIKENVHIYISLMAFGVHVLFGVALLYNKIFM